MTTRICRWGKAENTKTLYGSNSKWRLCRTRQCRVMEWFTLISVAGKALVKTDQSLSAHATSAQHCFPGHWAQLESETTKKYSHQVTTVSPFPVFFVFFFSKSWQELRCTVEWQVTFLNERTDTVQAEDVCTIQLLARVLRSKVAKAARW